MLYGFRVGPIGCVAPKPSTIGLILGKTLHKANRTGCPQARNDHCIALRHGCAERFEPGGRWESGDIDEILHYDRYSMKRGSSALSLSFHIECSRFFESSRVQRYDGVYLRTLLVIRLDTV